MNRQITSFAVAASFFSAAIPLTSWAHSEGNCYNDYYVDSNGEYHCHGDEDGLGWPIILGITAGVIVLGAVIWYSMDDADQASLSDWYHEENDTGLRIVTTFGETEGAGFDFLYRFNERSEIGVRTKTDKMNLDAASEQRVGDYVGAIYRLRL
jgi:hypothetical protein